MNALAVPHSFLPDQGSDGTVLFGIQLYQRLISSNDIPTLDWYDIPIGNFTVDIVMAHEFGHILQFKERIVESWEMEPHADFMAGWAMAQVHKQHMPTERKIALQVPRGDRLALQVETSAQQMFSFGDTAFTNRDHHGEPLFRAVMVRAGYEFGNLEAKEAFEKGRQWVGLERKPS